MKNQLTIVTLFFLLISSCNNSDELQQKIIADYEYDSNTLSNQINNSLAEVSKLYESHTSKYELHYKSMISLNEATNEIDSILDTINTVSLSNLSNDKFRGLLNKVIEFQEWSLTRFSVETEKIIEPQTTAFEKILNDIEENNKFPMVQRHRLQLAYRRYKYALLTAFNYYLQPNFFRVDILTVAPVKTTDSILQFGVIGIDTLLKGTATLTDGTILTSKNGIFEYRIRTSKTEFIEGSIAVENWTNTPFGFKLEK